jgi:arylsulfatase
LHALPEDLARYRGKYRVGFEKTRAARLQRQIASGLFTDRIALPDLDEATPDWDSLTAGQRDEWDLRMAIYAAQIDRMDQGIGRLLAALHDSGADANTLIFFLSDNGASHETIDRSLPGSTLGER